MLHIVTGKIDAGKTTTMQNLHQSLGGDGFVSLKTMKDGRPLCFDALRLKTGETRPLIKRISDVQGDKTAFSIGPYVFLKDTVDWIKETLKTLPETTSGPIFFDEVGLLEIDKQGFYDDVAWLIKENITLYLSVRTESLNSFLKTFHVTTYELKEV